MTNKDKSFFAKIILVSIIFIAFLIVLGLTAEVVKNKGVVNSQPQVSASSQISITPTPFSVISGWKFYENERYGYKIEYPSDYIFSERELKEKNDNVYYNTVKLIQNDNSIIEVKISLKNEDGFERLYDNSEYKKMKVDNHKAFRRDGVGLDYFNIVEVLGDNFLYTFQYSDNRVDYDQVYPNFTGHVKNDVVQEVEKNIEIFDQIISTFKFTDSIREKLVKLYNLEIDNTTEKNLKRILAEIKSIYKKDGITYFSIDILSPNPEFVPGLTPFFLNQSTKLKEVYLENTTKVYGCKETVASEEYPIEEFIKEVEENNTYYFDIDNNAINSVYGQCLP